MATRALTLYRDPVLHTPTAPVTEFDRELRRLVRDMIDTMYAEEGVGLAANQVGVGLRIFTYDVEGQLGHVVNPVLHLDEEARAARGKQAETVDEGCLSLPGLSARTPRQPTARVTGVDVHGQPVEVAGEGTLAQCLQHEVDHLDGLVYLDRLPAAARKRLLIDIGQAPWSQPDAVPQRPAPMPNRIGGLLTRSRPSRTE